MDIYGLAGAVFSRRAWTTDERRATGSIQQQQQLTQRHLAATDPSATRRSVADGCSTGDGGSLGDEVEASTANGAVDRRAGEWG